MAAAWSDQPLAAGTSAPTRVLTEDALKHLHWCAVNQQQPTIHSLAGVLQISENRTADLLTAMQNRNLVEVRPDGLQLTTAGMEYALHGARPPFVGALSGR
ncbi:MAG: hypothetical protein IPO15_02510 [Anaerolineae bacterium]|uniref:hypothetical protein n=1 Tax=Candidatus Amarolinea dominans TaxID=3140696 RepID=UPI003136FB01|nr:hypothetical protein [Anaerolineae bacterium]